MSMVIPNWTHRTVMPPGHWRAVNRITDKPGDPVEVLKFTCPQCGAEGDLSDHDIDGDGVVKPSVECPECGFHDHIELQHYGEPAPAGPADV